MLVVVLNDCVTETNETECRSNNSTSLAKSESERVSRSILDPVGDYSPNNIFGKTFGRDCAEQHVPSGAKRVDAEGPNLIDLGFDRSGVNGPLSHGLSRLTIYRRRVSLCFRWFGGDDAVDTLAINPFGFEGQAKFLAHHAGKEPTD
jgi:hypothetical protein